MLIDFTDGDRYAGESPEKGLHYRKTDKLATRLPAVPNCSPPLGGLQDLVAQLNEDRDLYTFIKRGECLSGRDIYRMGR